MFTRRDNIQKRLLKIQKQESKTLQVLQKQEDELKKALDENNQLISIFLDKESKEEKSLQQEIDLLSKRRETLEEKLSQVRNLCLWGSVYIPQGYTVGLGADN